MMVIGNKIDKEGERVVSTEEGEEFGRVVAIQLRGMDTCLSRPRQRKTPT